VKSNTIRLVVLKDGTRFEGYKYHNNCFFNDESLFETTYKVTRAITIGINTGDIIKVGDFSISYIVYK